MGTTSSYTNAVPTRANDELVGVRGGSTVNLYALAADPAAATDSGTDAYTVDIGRDWAADTIAMIDFGSANTTTAPTLENTGGTPSGAQTIKRRDGSALVAGDLNGVHALQFDGTDFGLLDLASVYSQSEVDTELESYPKTIIPTTTATGVSEVDVDLSSFTSDYTGFEVRIYRAEPATAGANFQMQMSNDGGSSFDSGGSDYEFAFTRGDSSGSTPSTIGSTGADHIRIANDVESSEGDGFAGVLWLPDPTDTSVNTPVEYYGGWKDDGTGNRVTCNGDGYRKEKASVDAIRLFFSSGNVARIKYSVVGYP